MRMQVGMTLIETLAVLAILAMAVTITVPDLLKVHRDVNFVRLARQVAGDAWRCRMEALTSCRNVGLIFCEEQGRWYYTMVADGNWNGVSRADFLGGRDKAINSRVWLEFLSAGTRVGVPVGWRVPDPSGDGVLPADGLRIGRSNIISFSPQGNATPCSVYFNDGRERLLCIRMSGELGRIRTLEWRRGWPRWVEVTL
jgi:prepilin-type N-terminal cleavage/methylation domain-containing protein